MNTMHEGRLDRTHFLHNHCDIAPVAVDHYTHDWERHAAQHRARYRTIEPGIRRVERLNGDVRFHARHGGRSVRCDTFAEARAVLRLMRRGEVVTESDLIIIRHDLLVNSFTRLLAKA